MKKLKMAVLLLFAGWFYMVQAEGSVKNTLITTYVGLFDTEQACKADYKDTVAMFEVLGVVLTNQKACTFFQEV